MMIMERIAECVIKGDYQKMASELKVAISQGQSPEEIINQGLLKGMEVVGERFRNEEIFVPEVMVAARAMHTGLDELKPFLSQIDYKTHGTVVIGTVKGDMHDIGKNIVSLMFEGSGFKVIDLGVDVPPEKFLNEAQSSGAKVVGLSALLTTTISAMAKTIEFFRNSNMKDDVKILVGGAPLTEATAQKIGADGYGKNAAEGVFKAKKLLGLL